MMFVQSVIELPLDLYRSSFLHPIPSKPRAARQPDKKKKDCSGLPAGELKPASGMTRRGAVSRAGFPGQMLSAHLSAQVARQITCPNLG